VLIAGGDGTIGTAASVLLAQSCELAILPGGTLNHFAGDLGIPSEPAGALALAASGGVVAPVDVGVVNDHLFLNTSSVGAYVRFVRVREYLEKRFGYRIASFLAAIRILFQLRMIVVELEVDGQRKIYRTPLVFIGVGERELKMPTLGSRVENGRSGLHVMIVRGRGRARLLALGLAAVARGVKAVSHTPELDSFIVDECTISRRRMGPVALDGELVTMGPTLRYALHRGALRVVVPATAARSAAAADAAALGAA
jgi:diacylglycerol kinase family enzyme